MAEKGQACGAPTALVRFLALRTQRLRTGLTCVAPLALKRGLPVPEKRSGMWRTYGACAFGFAYPALTRWANVCRASGAKKKDRSWRKMNPPRLDRRLFLERRRCGRG